MLAAETVAVHSCDEHLGLRRRTVAGGATHIVRQCAICGQQRHGPLSKMEATRLLGGREAEPFDDSAEHEYRQLRLSRVKEQQRIEQRIAQLENPDSARMDAEAQSRREASLERARQAIADAVDAVSVLPPPRREPFLIGELLARRGGSTETASCESGHEWFKNENEVRTWLLGWLEQDFDVWQEVPGVHLAERVRVRVDLVLRPKPHLVDAGFMPCFFGVEVKHLPVDGGFSPKASRAVRQAMSYMDSEFDVAGVPVRLQRVLLFTNLSFDCERNRLRGLDPSPLANDKAKWTALLELANHGNVGNFEIYGNRARWKGWRIAFATGKYFSRYLKDYELADSHLFAKVRVGNF